MKSPERQPFGSEALRAALRYRQLGWSVLPIHPPTFGEKKSGKNPAVRTWKQFTVAACSEAEIRDFFGRDRDYSIAIMCGQVSHLVAVDADSKEAMSFVRKNLPATPLISRTGNGEHHFYKWPGFEIRPGNKLRGLPLDLRGDNSYVVAAPSRHWSGRYYKWVCVPSKELIEQMPVFDPAWLMEERTYKQSTISIDPFESRLRLIRRAIAYIDKMEPAVSGQGGHNSLFRAVCKLLKPEPEGFGLTESEALPIIAGFNARAVPPFSDKDVEHKIQSVVSRIRSSIGGA